MTLPKLGLDPMDMYSTPMSEIKTKYGRLFQMQVRDTKPRRILAVAWDSRIPLVEGFENIYSYTVTFHEIGNTAGNHYHHNKQEIFYPIIGDFNVILEDPKTKGREEIELKQEQHQALYVPTEIAHAVIALSNPAVLLVIASYPSSEEEEVTYKLT